MSKDKVLKGELVHFQIKVVDVLSSSIQLPKNPVLTTPTFNFNISLEQKLDHDNKSLIIITNIDITTAEDLDFKLGTASIGCLFAIENYSDVVKVDKNNQAIINPDVLDILNSISISTARGVLSQLFRGTYLHHAILPIIDPKTLKKDI